MPVPPVTVKMDDLISALKAAFPDAEIERLNGPRLRLQMDGCRVTLNLGNLNSLAPEDRPPLIDDYVRALSAQLGPQQAPSRDNVIMVVRHHALAAEMNDDCVSEPYVGELALFLAVDSASGLRYLTKAQGAALPGEALWTAAKANLDRALGDPELHSNDGFHMLTAGGNFEACLLLFDTLWDASLADQVAGELVVGVPSRDVIVFTGSEDETGLQRMQSTIDRISATGNHPLTRQRFVRRQGAWRVF